MRIIKMLNVFTFQHKASPKIPQASDFPECGKCNFLLINVIVFTRTFLYSHRQYLKKSPRHPGLGPQNSKAKDQDESAHLRDLPNLKKYVSNNTN